MKSKRRGNKLVLMLNKRIIANLNHKEMFNVRSGDDVNENLLSKTHRKVCDVKETNPKVCEVESVPPVCRPVPMDFGIPTR